MTNQPRMWHDSSAMIFWGILALTLFGLIASVLESLFGIFDGFFRILNHYADMTSQFGAGDNNLYKLVRIYENTTLSMRVFQILTIAGWIFYVYGLSRFRHAQTTERAADLTGRLYSACRLGLVSMLCYFLASWLGWFGVLFRLAGWILLLVSLFKFRGAFSRLTREESWNATAQRGAATLRTSYTLAIILQLFPLICGILLLFAFFGMASQLPSLLQNF